MRVAQSSLAIRTILSIAVCNVCDGDLSSTSCPVLSASVEILCVALFVGYQSNEMDLHRRPGHLGSQPVLRLFRPANLVNTGSFPSKADEFVPRTGTINLIRADMRWHAQGWWGCCGSSRPSSSTTAGSSSSESLSLALSLFPPCSSTSGSSSSESLSLYLSLSLFLSRARARTHALLLLSLSISLSLSLSLSSFLNNRWVFLE